RSTSASGVFWGADSRPDATGVADWNRMMEEDGRSGDTRDESQEKAFSVIDRRPVFQNETSAASEPRYPSVVEELKARTEEAERRAREISAAYRRIEEEREAFRVRLARDLERRVEIARVEMMRKVLGV